MKPNKNIDRLFQEKLRDFEEMPPDDVWDNIDAQLNGKKKRRIIPIWWRYAGVAVVLLLLTFSGVQYFKTVDNVIDIDNTIVDINNNDTPLIDENKEINDTSNNNIIVSSSDNFDEKQSPTTINQDDNVINNEQFIQNDSSAKESNVVTKNNTQRLTTESRQEQVATLKDEKPIAETNSLIAKTEVNKALDKNQTHTANEHLSINEDLKKSSKESTNLNEIATTDLPTNTIVNQSEILDEKKVTEEVAYEHIENLEDTLDDKYKIPVEEKTDDVTKRWSVATVVAPVFYNSFNTKGSPLDLQFENSPKEGSQTVSYGVKVEYKLNNKWSVQSGVSMINVGYSVGDVYINPSTQAGLASRLTNVDYIPTATILNVSTQNIISDNLIETSITEPIKGSLNQEYGYVEVPLEIKYSLTNGKLGVHLIGGFSTLFLNNNEVFVETLEFSSELGEARNLNNVDFSGNFGFDVDYSINKHLYINVSPMLKVYTNTFSENYENSDNFKPYLFGVYTGLNYRF
ncbi:MAG: outer membrane beta-barrel protein [Urechidicola sp.]|nr:outer membrane beta-barrel protein [Urechidicola sp.]